MDIFKWLKLKFFKKRNNKRILYELEKNCKDKIIRVRETWILSQKDFTEFLTIAEQGQRGPMANLLKSTLFGKKNNKEHENWVHYSATAYGATVRFTLDRNFLKSKCSEQLAQNLGLLKTPTLIKA